MQQIPTERNDMENEDVTPSRRRGLVAALLGVAAFAVALPASGALAGGGDGEPAGAGGSAAAAADPGFPQNAQDDSRQRHDGRDCPKDKDGERGGSEREGSAGQGADESPQL